MLKYLLLIAMLLPSFAQSAHLATNLQCLSVQPESKVSMVFQVVKRNKLHRLQVDFEALKGGEFKAGDTLDVIVREEVVGSLKLKGQGDKLKGRFKVQGSDPDFPIEDIKRGTASAIAGHTCTFKRR